MACAYISVTCLDCEVYIYLLVYLFSSFICFTKNRETPKKLIIHLKWEVKNEKITQVNQHVDQILTTCI